MHLKNKVIKNIFLSVFTVICATLIVVGVVKAGSLTPSLSPDSTMYTLEDIYNKIVSGTNASSHTLNSASTPTPTMHTLTDIYTVAGEHCVACGATELTWSDQAPDAMDWATATTYCAAMTDGGYTWSLPTIGDLLKGLGDQFISGTQTGFQYSTDYWSSSEIDDYSAWYAYFSDVVFNNNDNKTSGYSVRCVH